MLMEKIAGYDPFRPISLRQTWPGTRRIVRGLASRDLFCPNSRLILCAFCKPM